MGIPLIPKPAVSVIAGVLVCCSTINVHVIGTYTSYQFGVAWLMLIDGHVFATHMENMKIEWWYYMPGVVGTVALLMYFHLGLIFLHSYLFFFHLGLILLLWRNSTHMLFLMIQFPTNFVLGYLFHFYSVLVQLLLLSG